jgi:hypothetical protein
MPAGLNDDAVTTEADDLADICKDPARPAEPLSAVHGEVACRAMPQVMEAEVRQAGGSGRSL